MKKIILAAMLVGLLTAAGFAQRGGAPMGGSRGMTETANIHTNSVGPHPQLVRPNAVQMAPVAKRPGATTTAPNKTTTPSSTGTTSTNTGNNGRTSPPDAAVPPNTGQRTLNH